MIENSAVCLNCQYLVRRWNIKVPTVIYGEFNVKAIKKEKWTGKKYIFDAIPDKEEFYNDWIEDTLYLLSWYNQPVNMKRKIVTDYNVHQSIEELN